MPAVQTATTLLEQTAAVAKRYAEIAELTGENYNVFNVLGLTSAENYHSAFLADLLNPNGLHGMGAKFLELFIRQVAPEGIKVGEKEFAFDAISAKVRTEYHVCFKNADQTEGGRIDIWMEDQNHQRILIENKIYAGDQYRQLVRYRNYDPNALLLYLNLWGNNASERSTSHEKGQVQTGAEYHCISYQDDIPAWLDGCIKEAASMPILRETLQQYLYLIKQLTHQSTNAKMANELVDLIAQNPQNYSLVLQLNNAAYEARRKAFTAITQELENIVKNINTNVLMAITLPDDVKIHCTWGSDANDPFFWAFYAINNEFHTNQIEDKDLQKFAALQDKIRKE